MNDSISVILSGYRRPHTFKEQFDAISNQSFKPSEILFWKNEYKQTNFDASVINNCKSALCNHNFGVWARFAYALNCKSKYICIFDDDTIPGQKWLENCVQSFKEKVGLYGTIGLIFSSANTYYAAKRVGWDGINNEDITQVDIVGHAWFFSREMLSIFWREMPSPDDIYVGEDMHFSHMLQKYSEFKTYVPPHPIGDKSLWGSLKAVEYGGDANATANFAVPIMDSFFKRMIAQGFKIIS